MSGVPQKCFACPPSEYTAATSRASGEVRTGATRCTVSCLPTVTGAALEGWCELASLRESMSSSDLGPA